MSGRHILFIASWYPNRCNPTHGIFNRAFVKALADAGTNVSVLYAGPDKNVKKGFEIVQQEEPRIFTVHVYYPPAGERAVLPKLRQFMRRRAACLQGFNAIVGSKGMPQLIQLNVMLPGGPGALALSRRYRLPLVINECWTGFDPADGRYRGFVAETLTRKIFSGAKVVMPVSDHLQRLMQSHGLQGNYRVVPNVVDTEIFAPATKKEEGILRFIHVSALDDAQKNVSGIIRSYLAAKEHLPDSELVIAGDGPDSAMLRELAETLGAAGSIKFKGSLSPVQLANEMNASDALIMFSNYETFCVAVPEALACGKPVITSDAGGIMSYMHPGLGLIVPTGDTHALKEAIIAFPDLRMKYDPVVLRSYVETRFAPARVAAQLHEVYSSVLVQA